MNNDVVISNGSPIQSLQDLQLPGRTDNIVKITASATSTGSSSLRKLSFMQSLQVTESETAKFQSPRLKSFKIRSVEAIGAMRVCT